MRPGGIAGHEQLRNFERQCLPVIAAIQGGAIGGGVDLSTACDFRYATEDEITRPFNYLRFDRDGEWLARFGRWSAQGLYPDETLFLRELLQNALDACRYQKARALDAGMGDKYIPRIQVWDGSSLPHDPEDPDKGPRIVFQDNGVGMSLDAGRRDQRFVVRS